MKKLVILVLASVVAVPAMSQGFADKLVNQYRVGYDEAVLLGGLARDFGISDSNMFDLRNRYGYRNDDMINALYVNKYGRTNWDDIHRMRQSGMGWGQIAHKIGMHPGQFNKMRKDQRWKSDREMSDDLWRDRFDKKGSRSSDVDWARNQGFSYRDAYIADQIARSNSSRLPTVLNRYRQSSSWKNSGLLTDGNARRGTIADAIGRNPAKKASPPKKNNSGNNKGKSNENRGTGKGKSKGKSKSKSKGGFLDGR
ncbi:MAG: hypothetical protein ABIV13_07260 [Fimbriimonadales bacterium]